MAKKLPLLGRFGRSNSSSSGSSSSSPISTSSASMSSSETESPEVSSAALDLGLEMSSTSATSLESEAVDGGGGETGRSFGEVLAKARSFGIWTGFFSLVFTLCAWTFMPTKAIAWRLSQIAKSNGFIVEIEDVSVMPWGTVTLENVAWHFPTKRPTDSPVPFVAESLSVRIAPIRYLLGSLSGSIEGEVDTGYLRGSFYRGSDGLKVELDLDEVPLYALPKVQQSLNAPVRGDLSLDVTLSSPDATFAAASGEIRIQCTDCKIGDGETKLFVPSAKGMLANGMTVPEINFGNINGAITIEDGVGTAEEILSKSDDVTVMIYGALTLGEPVSNSDLNMRIKLFISKEMQAANADIGLMVATASSKTKLTGEDEGGLGYRLLGTFGRPKLRTFKYKSAKERRDERAEKGKKNRGRPSSSTSRANRKRPAKRVPVERAKREPTPDGSNPKIDTARARPPGAGDTPEPTEAFLGRKSEPPAEGAGDGGEPPTDAQAKDNPDGVLDPFGPDRSAAVPEPDPEVEPDAEPEAEPEEEPEEESEEEEDSDSGESSESGSDDDDDDDDE